jgi:hypothetical protein
LFREFDMKPYAVYLLERFEAGETAEELALSEGIPLERIRIRLAAAAEFQERRAANSNPAPETALRLSESS